MKKRKKHKRPNAPVLIGTYKLGVENVRLFSGLPWEGAAASFLFAPDDGGCPAMTINLEGVEWHDVLSGVLHEAIESRLHRSGCGHIKTHVARDSSDKYLFVMTHPQMDEAVHAAATFLSDCSEDLNREWYRLNPPPRECGEGRGKENKKKCQWSVGIFSNH